MRDVVYSLSVPATATTDLTSQGGGVGTGVPKRSRDMRDKVVELSSGGGSFTGTVAIEVKVANAFVAYGAAISFSQLPMVLPIDISADWMRVNVTSMTGGTAPVCVLRGLDTRSEG